MNSHRTTRKYQLKSVLLVSTLALLLTVVGLADAQQSSRASGKNVPRPPSQSEGPTDPAELEAFLDELMTKHMEEYHVAGAAISVVKDGKLFFAKGYGYADVEKGIAVDPAQTIFGVGSVGKMFTWTAVMQLVEQGKLDLDEDINTYLDFRIPDTYPQPITLKHLISHTSGFEDKLLGGAVWDAKDLLPARDWLVSNMVARVHSPGEFAGYSNFNAILAGYIVAQVSGQPYDQYIQEHIFDPLGMQHSTVKSPMPEELRSLVSVGYTYKDGAFQAFPAYLGQPGGAPSGLHHATVTDMARFMIALLEGGRYGDVEIPEARILSEATARQMQTTLYTPDPRLLGTAYGFAYWNDNGQRTLGHTGYLPPMHSVLLLLPDQNLGVFVVYNSKNAGRLTLQHSGFQRAFFDHYFPASAVTPLQPPADFAERAARFTGVYRFSSSPATSLIKIVEIFGAYRATISDPGDGTLGLSVEGLKLRFVEVEPLFFRQVDGPFAMIFFEDGRGRITTAYTDLMPQYTMVKLQWYETTGFNVALALGCVLMFLSMPFVAPIRMLRNRRLDVSRKPEPRGARRANWIILAICVLNLLFAVGVALWGNPPSELHSISLNAKIVLGLGLLSALLTLGALVYMVLAWKNSYWSIATRVYYTVVTVAAVAFVWFLNYWNLLGWRY